MKHKKLGVEVITVVAIIAILIIVIVTREATLAGSPIARVCEDTDEGIKEFVKGTLTGTQGTRADRCADANKLDEWFCARKGQFKRQRITCEFGCAEGACTIGPSTPPASPVIVPAPSIPASPPLAPAPAATPPASAPAPPNNTAASIPAPVPSSTAPVAPSEPTPPAPAQETVPSPSQTSSSSSVPQNTTNATNTSQQSSQTQAAPSTQPSSTTSFSSTPSATGETTLTCIFENPVSPLPNSTSVRRCTGFMKTDGVGSSTLVECSTSGGSCTVAIPYSPRAKFVPLGVYYRDDVNGCVTTATTNIIRNVSITQGYDHTAFFSCLPEKHDVTCTFVGSSSEHKCGLANSIAYAKGGQCTGRGSCSFTAYIDPRAYPATQYVISETRTDTGERACSPGYYDPYADKYTLRAGGGAQTAQFRCAPVQKTITCQFNNWPGEHECTYSPGNTATVTASCRGERQCSMTVSQQQGLIAWSVNSKDCSGGAMVYNENREPTGNPATIPFDCTRVTQDITCQLGSWSYPSPSRTCFATSWAQQGLGVNTVSCAGSYTSSSPYQRTCTLQGVTGPVGARVDAYIRCGSGTRAPSSSSAYAIFGGKTSTSINTDGC